MFVCKDCGAHYNSEFLQCPQCGSTKRVSETEDKTNNSVIGSIISIAVILGLLGLIGTGVYFLLNPVTPGSPISELEYIDNDPTTSSTSKATTTTGTTTTRLTTTTTKLVGTEGRLLGNRTYTIPEGFQIIDFNPSDYEALNLPSNTQCIYSADMEQYCIGILEGQVFSPSSSEKQQLNENLASVGFSEIIKAQFYGKTVYYTYTKRDTQIIGALYKNNSYGVISSAFVINADIVNEESMYKLISIINSIH